MEQQRNQKVAQEQEEEVQNGPLPVDELQVNPKLQSFRKMNL